MSSNYDMCDFTYPTKNSGAIKASGEGIRLGNPISRYSGERRSADMRVVDDALKAVVFIGTENGGTFVPYGTALVAFYEFEGEGFGFLVTAAHVVAQIPTDSVVARFNMTDGKLGKLVLPKSNVMLHQDASNDLAMLPFDHSNGIFEYRYVAIGRDKLEKDRAVWEPGLGDEVFAVGVYTNHYGTERNVPVVRVGNISMMPGEPVLNSAGYTTAYLIEVRSLAGLSGAPIFANVPLLRIVGTESLDTKGTGYQVLSGPRYNLIGIMLGYHLVRSAEDQILEEGETANPQDRNTGLAVVVPIERVYEILERADAVAAMRGTIQAYRKNSSFRQAATE